MQIRYKTFTKSRPGGLFLRSVYGGLLWRFCIVFALRLNCSLVIVLLFADFNNSAIFVILLKSPLALTVPLEGDAQRSRRGKY